MEMLSFRGTSIAILALGSLPLSTLPRVNSSVLLMVSVSSIISISRTPFILFPPWAPPLRVTSIPSPLQPLSTRCTQSLVILKGLVLKWTTLQLRWAFLLRNSGRDVFMATIVPLITILPLWVVLTSILVVWLPLVRSLIKQSALLPWKQTLQLRVSEMTAVLEEHRLFSIMVTCLGASRMALG